MNKDIILRRLLLLVIVFVAAVKADYQSPFSFKTDEEAILFGQFGFYEGGRFSVNVDLSSNVDRNEYYTPENLNRTIIEVLVCKDRQFSDAFDDYCALRPTCIYQQPLSNEGYSQYSVEIEQDGYYYFLLTKCSQSIFPLTYRVSYTTYNPGDNHLSAELIPLPHTFMLFTAIWGVLSILWSVNWIMHRRQNVKLHKIITLFPFSKLCDVIYSLGYYQYYRSHGATSVAVVILYWVFYIIFKIISLIVLLFISSGWGICPGRYKSLITPLVIIIVLLGVTLALGSFFGGYYIVISFIVYIPVLCMIFFKADVNIKKIRLEIEEEREKRINSQTTTTTSTTTENANAFSIDEESNQSNSHETQVNTNNNNNNNNNNDDKDKKNEISDQTPEIARKNQILNMFVIFKWIMIGFIILVIVIQFLSVAFPMGWVFQFMMMLVEVALFICIGLTFRLRKQVKDSYYEFIDESNNDGIELH
ncbi:hypothetical protein CYY_000408 [Polysphondylium violaceum]|uniref:GOST seven transmembrane domain-containing protein n=1 Tax=Polysphondylium violaceum TaxID=133409 RepID=A0A8J4UX84_9MYCE|nr:hypothetical protein CYY_000408 [Polysphondylium violaceum]